MYSWGSSSQRWPVGAGGICPQEPAEKGRRKRGAALFCNTKYKTYIWALLRQHRRTNHLHRTRHTLDVISSVSTRWTKKIPPTTFVDNTAMHGNFCTKFYTIVKRSNIHFITKFYWNIFFGSPGPRNATKLLATGASPQTTPESWQHSTNLLYSWV